MGKAKGSLLKWVGIISAVICAVIMAIPNGKLDWDGVVLPMANEYMNISTEDQSISLTPLNGVNVVISGATSGIGLGLTGRMCQLGATVIAMGRNPRKLQQLQKDNGACNILTVVSDFMDLDTVSKAAEEILSLPSIDRIDILINNAGIHEKLKIFEKNQGAQGFDSVFTVNYLSHVILTEKLLPMIEKSQRPTILQITSSFHWTGNHVDLLPPVSVVDGKTKTSPPVASIPGGALAMYAFRTYRGYGNSKLAQILYARGLKRALGNDKFRIVSICPAWVGTQIAGESGFFPFFLKTFSFAFDGYGLASCFYAIFHNNPNHEKSDFFINTGMMSTKILGVATYLPFSMALRDFYMFNMAHAVLPIQKLYPRVFPSVTSPESYNTRVQDEFYAWTKETLQKWL